MTSQKWGHQKVLMSAEVLSMYLTLSKKKHNIGRFRDCIRSDSKK